MNRTDHTEERQNAIDVLEAEPIRSFFLAYIIGDPDGTDHVTDLGWISGYDVQSGRKDRLAAVLGITIYAVAEELGLDISEVARQAEEQARYMATNADRVP